MVRNIDEAGATPEKTNFPNNCVYILLRQIYIYICIEREKNKVSNKWHYLCKMRKT